MRLVPIIHHLEQLPFEVFARHPEVRAVGDEKAWRKVGRVTPACFSQPKTESLMADWLTCLGKYRHVSEVNVWLAEKRLPCQCSKCRAVDPFLLQTQVAVRAWQSARRTRPDLRLRILLTQGSYSSNAQILAAVPAEVGVVYYDGSRTYNVSREPMIYPLLEEYAAQGRWLGCYPQLMPSWRLVSPWSGPQFIKALMSEYVTKRLRCLCADTAQQVELARDAHPGSVARQPRNATYELTVERFDPQRRYFVVVDLVGTPPGPGEFAGKGQATIRLAPGAGRTPNK